MTYRFVSWHRYKGWGWQAAACEWTIYIISGSLTFTPWEVWGWHKLNNTITVWVSSVLLSHSVHFILLELVRSIVQVQRSTYWLSHDAVTSSAVNVVHISVQTVSTCMHKITSWILSCLLNFSVMSLFSMYRGKRIRLRTHI